MAVYAALVGNCFMKILMNLIKGREQLSFHNIAYLEGHIFRNNKIVMILPT